MKSLLKLLLIILLVQFDSISSAQTSYNPEAAIGKYLERFQIQDGTNFIDLYSVAGLKQTNMYGFAIEKLKDASIRKETYKRVLKGIALQSSLEITNLFQIVNCKGGFDSETTGEFYSEMANFSGSIIEPALEISANYNKAYSKIRDSKKFITGISKNDLKVMSNLASVISIIQNVAEAKSQITNINTYYLMLTATSFDLGLKRMKELKTYNIIYDKAYISALDEVISELENFPVSFWEKAYYTILNNGNAVGTGIQSFVDLMKDAASLVTQGSSSALGASLGWVGAFVSVYNTYDMIRDWNQEWRDIALSGTIYKNLSNKGYSSQNYIDMTDYTQFLFLHKFAACMENSNLIFWEIFKPDQKSVRLYVENDLTDFINVIVKKRSLALTCEKKKDDKSNHEMTICLIIDSSGSMTDSDPKDVRKKGISQVVDLLTGKENVFLVDFDDQSKWLTSSNWNRWTSSDLKNAILSINSSGGTNVGNGIQTLRDALEQNIQDYSKCAVILLTDGMGTYNKEAEWFAQKGVKIYTISYKDKADANLLQSISGSTGGIYIQANDENDVVTAFMQFNNDLQGLSRYISYRGNFKGQRSFQLPGFYVDLGCNQMTGMLNSFGLEKDFSFVSPSGKSYLADMSGEGPEFRYFAQYKGPFASVSDETPELIKGPGYVIMKIKNPEPGEWKTVVSTSDSSPSNDDFMFEAMGDSETEIILDESRSAGVFQYKIDSDEPSLIWEKSKANIIVETPSGKTIDISGNYKNGSFFFYPSAGIGNYQVNATVLVEDKQKNIYQRQFSRSELVGELLPGYIAPISQVNGSYISTEQGTITGNRPGIRCVIYAPGSSSTVHKAKGYVTFVSDRQCTIEVSEVVRGQVTKGDIVELDLLQWKNDNARKPVP